ncbi:MAG: hypothetical protein D3904_05175, partial [Candidatus Electrothrix sp. EH2]|nr:hypothetical protein [Candidatus Electrothrix sp. EH2]
TITLETDILLDAPLPGITSTVIIEGQGHTVDGNNDPDVGSVLTIGIYGNFTLNEATVTGGNSHYGGGIANLWWSGTLIVNNSTISGNSVSSGDHHRQRALGGGIYNRGTLVLTNSTVSGNSIPYINGEGEWAKGGGIYNEGDLTLTNSTVNSNSVACGNDQGQMAGGGGIGNWADDNTTFTLTNSTVSDNSAVCERTQGQTAYGGGIENRGDMAVTLNNSKIIGNSAGHGGGIANFGSIIVNNSTISGNAAAASFGEGGGIYNLNGEFTLINSTVSGNTADSGHGGGIANFGSIIVNNSTISGNSADYAGGIYNLRSAITLSSSIVSGNTATTKGNEVYNYDSSNIIVNSYNLFGHSGETNDRAFYDFTPGSTDITATSDGTNPTALSAILSPLADNGGPTMTHALVPGSPAIDLDADCSTGLTEDQRGYPRPEAEGTGCDAGAFEGSVSPVNNNTFLPAIYLLLLNQ